MIIPSPEYLLRITKAASLNAAPDVPAEVWWLPCLVLFILGAGAMVDALTARIPDSLVFLGLLAVTLALGITVDWPYAASHLRWAVATGIGLWVLNELWRKQFKEDAYGMGDAKWTMLVVACFGFPPALFCWGTGACLSVVWMGGMKIARRPITHVYFGPFLFIGLLIGLYWLRLR